MASDYELSDDDAAYYDSDEDMMDTQEDGMSDDDMEMDAYNDNFKISGKPKRKAYELDYTSLSQAAVEDLMRADVDHICGIFGVDEPTASMLLRHASWNKEKLIEKYMDNPSMVMVSAGCSLPEPPSTSSTAPIRSQPSTRRTTRATSKLLSLGSPSKSSDSKPPATISAISKPVKPSKDELFVCPICFDDSPDLNAIALSCEHFYCSGCWTAYITSKIRDESEQSISCMAEGCTLVAPDPYIQSVLLPESVVLSPEEKAENEATWKRFLELLVRHYVGTNSTLKFCPYPACTNTVKCPSASSKSSLSSVVPTVSCGARGIPSDSTAVPTNASSISSGSSSVGVSSREHKFCFGCPIDSDHRPVVCAVAKLWLKKCADDSETANWIKSNTKECSKCQSTIEKNGGCNHMTCKKCKWEFCWVCMGPWSEHGTAFYTCNRYEEKAGVDARDQQSKSRASLERYLHYYNRWANHEQSAKLSLDLYAKTEKKMEEMQITSSLTWIEVQFMKKAVEEVDKCRMTLKWTYAMAYYLAKGNQKELFEDNQRDLEKAVEDLSEMLESPIDPEKIAELRQKVTDKTVYVTNRNEVVLDDTANGFLESRWKWNVQVDGFDDEDIGEVAWASAAAAAAEAK